MHPDVESILFSEEQLKKRVEEIGAQITRDFAGKQPLFVGVLKGSFMFMADLMRCVDLSCSAEVMAVSSYGKGTSSSGQVQITKDLSGDITGKPPQDNACKQCLSINPVGVKHSRN